MKHIDSVQNDTIKKLSLLKNKKYRDISDVVLVEGEHLIAEARSSGLLVETLSTQPPCDTLISEAVARKLSLTTSGSTQFGIVRKPLHSVDANATRALVLDGVQDPGNVGTIIRTAYSFGFDVIYLTPECADEFGDKTIRSSQGAVFHQAVIRMEQSQLVDILRQQGFALFVTDVQDAKGVEVFENHKKIAVVIGSEGKGVSEYFKAQKDDSVKIETSRFESLNAAIAAGILCYVLKK